MNRVASRLLAPALLAAALPLLLPAPAQARSDDRNQPMNIDADDLDGVLQDDGEVFLTGNVRMTQGTLDVRADRARVVMRSGEISHVTLWGAPARLHQIDDAGHPMDARARQFDYDMSGDVVILTGDVRVEQPRGTVSGDSLVYNLTTSRVNASGEAGGRVQLVIPPRTARSGD